MPVSLQAGDDLGLDRLELGVADEFGVVHFARLPQAPSRFRFRARGVCAGVAALTAAELHAAGFCAQFLELPDTALLAPHLVVLLANSIHGLRLIFAQAREGPYAIHLGSDVEVGAALRHQGEVRRENSRTDAGFLEILPANVGRLIAAEQAAI